MTRIALLAEGCYPYATGGVSTWCDQLIRGLDDHQFEVIAITSTGRLRPATAVPDNATLRTVPLWDWAGRPRRASRRARREFRPIYRRLLTTALDPGVAQRGFDLALRDLFEYAQQHGLAAAFAGDDALTSLMDLWPAAYPRVPIRVRDALEATELLAHLLRPLAAEVPRADVCHPVSNGLPALPALAAKWRYGTPMVISEHGVYLRERYLAFQSVEYRWPVKSVMLAFLRRLCRTAYQAADVIAPVNVFNRRWEVRHGADPDRIRTVYNGVDAAGLPAAERDPDVPTVGWVGRIDPLKDLHTLVRAFAAVRAQVPDAVLRLFGPTPAGNEEYQASVQALVRQLDLDQAVRFEGPVRPATAAYHASTVVALSSISEGLPYTVMEAMMCARATVSTDVGGVAEVAGDAGVVVPPRDPALMAGALIRLLSEPALRADLAARARDRALQLFRLDTMLATYRELYADLSGQPATASPDSAIPADSVTPDDAAPPAGSPSSLVGVAR